MARKSRYAAALPAPAAGRCAAGLYLRLSVEDGDDPEHNSIGNQRKICLEFLQSRPELTLGGVYTDNGCTGMDYRRPGFQALLADLTEGKLGCVVVKDLSRLGRHYILTSDYVERIFPEMGVRLVCVGDGYDSADPDADRAGLLLPFRLLLNDAYAKDVARKIRSSIRAKMAAGQFLPAAGSVPYGYVRDPAAATYAVDGESAPVVRRIFSLRAAGASFSAIAGTLNREAVPSPGRLRFDRGLTRAETCREALWQRGAIRRITEDQTYLGCRVHGKQGRDRLTEGKKSRPPAAWQVVPDAHPAIVTQDLFDRVQEVNRAEREKRAAFARRDAPARDSRELLRGKVFCGDCGAPMAAGKRTGRPGGASSVFFNCGRYRDSGRQRCCNHYIRQEALLGALDRCLEAQAAAAADVERLLEAARRAAGDSGELRAAQRRRDAAEARSRRLLEDWAAGLLDRETYRELKQRQAETLARLSAEESALRASWEARRQAGEAAARWLSAVQQYRADAAADRGIVDALVDRILVYRDRRVEIVLTCADPLEEAAHGE